MNLSFGRSEEWTIWSGVEVGKRILNFLNTKIDGPRGNISPHLSRNRLSTLSTESKCLQQQSSSHMAQEMRGKCMENISSALEESIPQTTIGMSSPINTSIFFNYSEPPISLGDYIDRLIKYTKNSISPVNLGVALLYIYRIEIRIEVNKYSIFRLFAVAYLIAHKYMDDSPSMKNYEYSKIAGIPLYELNNLEINFLKVIDFQLGTEHLCFLLRFTL